LTKLYHTYKIYEIFSNYLYVLSLKEKDLTPKMDFEQAGLNKIY